MMSRSEPNYGQPATVANHQTIDTIHMKIIIEPLGLPTLSAVIGRRVEMELPAATTADLVDRLVARFGPKARQVLLDADGCLDLTIQVMVNEEAFLPREELAKRELKDGDRVRLMLLAGGG